jgi:hypothetical protein
MRIFNVPSLTRSCCSHMSAATHISFSNVRRYSYVCRERTCLTCFSHFCGGLNFPASYACHSGPPVGHPIFVLLTYRPSLNTRLVSITHHASRMSAVTHIHLPGQWSRY